MSSFVAENCRVCGGRPVPSEQGCNCEVIERTWGLDLSDTPQPDGGDADDSTSQMRLDRMAQQASRREQSSSSGAPMGLLSVPFIINPDARYEVIETLGRGGSGLVLKVRDKELDEIIALKVLAPELGISDEAVTRFKREIKIARRINDPNVARLYDMFVWQGHLVISQDYIPGCDFGSVLKGARLSASKIARYVRYICSGLQAAHDIGVVHRDLKPDNIRIDEDDRPRILDFGLALLGSASETKDAILGTPSHMAPEQALTPHLVDHRADIYSLGVMLFYMVTGSLPFTARKPMDLIACHVTQDPPRPSELEPAVSPDLEELILTCLQKSPAKRPGSAREVELRVRHALAARVDKEQRARAGGNFVRRKVLIIDDNTHLRRSLTDMLDELHVEAIEARNGYEGVELALRESPDAILLDVMMPVLDGRETLRIIKSNPLTEHIPVIMMTAVENDEEAMLFRETGAEMLLSKPLRLEILELLLAKYAAGDDI